jgi:membrane protein implicated in regulation of membrane protease activity
MCHLALFLPVIALPLFWLWPLSVAGPVYVFVLALSAWAYYYAIVAMRLKPVSGRESLVGALGKVVSRSDGKLRVRIQGELWTATSTDELAPGDRIEVVGVDKITLRVTGRRSSKIGLSLPGKPRSV